MSKIIIIRGEGNSGKTTTASYLYQDLLTTFGVTSHQFNGKVVVKDSLERDSKKAFKDFVAILDINGKIVVIISAGDVWDDLIKRIDGLPDFDVLICCARTRNSITFRELKLKYGNKVTHVENIVKQIDEKKLYKQPYINSIISKI